MRGCGKWDGRCWGGASMEQRGGMMREFGIGMGQVWRRGQRRESMTAAMGEGREGAGVGGRQG